MLRFVPGFAVGLVLGGVLGFAGEVENGLVSGLLSGLVFGFASWLAIGVIAWAETPITEERPETPAITFVRDLRLVYVKSLAGGCALGVAFGVHELLTGANGLATGLSVGAVGAVAIVLGVGLHQPSGRYLVTMAAFRGRKRIPLRLLRFSTTPTGWVYSGKPARCTSSGTRSYKTASSADSTIHSQPRQRPNGWPDGPRRTHASAT
ncbi:hypothetical protein [Actinophytocola algeriensis]|uniref:Uncharacterized protein n=1 Tax=Actinophytocola algeriensis TaxID=1768010 RepID=A0A7W7VG77_9PSEU|nr:hypothetical protein [Actinophytocola algeriensis]MBB4908790.1 hypothetical protein [Actinophytocola algeriensis]MBE1474823.1 hypothetical protein [Actinophytocola algeriensis]